MTGLPLELEPYEDATFSELQDDDDDLGQFTEEDIEEVSEEEAEFTRLAKLEFATEILNEMFVKDEITLGEYWELTDYIEEEAAELDVSTL